MKSKQKPVKEPKAKKPPRERNSRKKLQFEDGVKAALIASAIICAAVLGIGGFFALRSVFSSEKPEISQITDSLPIENSEIENEIPVMPENPEITENLPSLEEALAELEAAAAGSAVPAPSDEQAPRGSPPAPSISSSTIPPQIPPMPANKKGTLILVIDDAGNNLRDLEPYLKFPGPITISVLPGLPYSVEAAKRIREAGKELFLHQPMESLSGRDSGPGAIKTGMSPAEVKEILIKNLNEIGPVAGFNNHEGSRATMETAIMRPLLEISRDSALIFLDSRTIADSVAPQIARELGISIAERDIFLDNEQDRASILSFLEAGCKRAEQNGTAILIGHVWSPQLGAILAEMYPVLLKQGFAFSTVSSAMNRGK